MTWILTGSGQHFDYIEARTRTINLIDIARSLSNECRFAGHGGFYSVAQHSVHCSEIVPPALAFEALLHDAAEAYCGDVTSPLKQLLPEYQKIERRVDIAIRLRFGLPPDCSPVVKFADLVMLATERRDLLPPDPLPWPILEGIQPRIDLFITRWSPQQAFDRFWARVAECLIARPRLAGGEVLA